MSNETVWRNLLDERQRKQVDFATLYADEFNHGTTGHSDLVLIALLAKLLDRGQMLAKPPQDRFATPIIEQYFHAGLSVVPICQGSKRLWNDRLCSVSIQEIMHLHREHKTGFGFACGRPSGGLLVFDVETQAAYEAWMRNASRAIGRVVDDLPVVATPSGGRHIYVRMRGRVLRDQVISWTGSARLVEIRGEGGYVVAPPTMQYYWLRNGFAAAGVIGDIPVLETDLIQALVEVSRCLSDAPRTMQQILDDDLIPAWAQNVTRLDYQTSVWESNNGATLYIGQHLREPIVVPSVALRILIDHMISNADRMRQSIVLEELREAQYDAYDEFYEEEDETNY